MTDVNRLLREAESGDPAATAALLPLLYKELRKLAAARLAAEAPGQTLQPTALVHEVYLRLLGPAGSNVRWDNDRHFFTAAAEAMRRILVENARRKSRLRHGGAMRRVERRVELLSASPTAEASDEVDLVMLDEALKGLAAEDALAARVVELRYFAGLGHEKVSATLGISVYQARQKWTYARAWLRDLLRDDG